MKSPGKAGKKASHGGDSRCKDPAVGGSVARHLKIVQWTRSTKCEGQVREIGRGQAIQAVKWVKDFVFILSAKVNF